MTEAQAETVIAQIEVLKSLGFYGCALAAGLLACVGMMYGATLWKVMRDAAYRVGFWGCVLLCLTFGREAVAFPSGYSSHTAWNTGNPGFEVSAGLFAAVEADANWDLQTLRMYYEYSGGGSGTWTQWVTSSVGYSEPPTVQSYNDWSQEAVAGGSQMPLFTSYEFLTNQGINCGIDLDQYKTDNSGSAVGYNVHVEEMVQAFPQQPANPGAPVCDCGPAPPAWAGGGGPFVAVGPSISEVTAATITIGCPGGYQWNVSGRYKCVFRNNIGAEAFGEWVAGGNNCFNLSICDFSAAPLSQVKANIGCVEKAIAASLCLGGQIQCTGDADFDCTLIASGATNCGLTCTEDPVDPPPCQAYRCHYLMDGLPVLFPDEDCNGVADIDQNGIYPEGCPDWCPTPEACPECPPDLWNEAEQSCDECPPERVRPDGTCSDPPEECEGDEDCDGCKDECEGQGIDGVDNDGNPCGGQCGCTVEGEDDEDCDGCPVSTDESDRIDNESCDVCKEKGGDADEDGCCDDEDADPEDAEVNCEDCGQKIVEKWSEFVQRVNQKFLTTPEVERVDVPWIELEMENLDGNRLQVGFGIDGHFYGTEERYQINEWAHSWRDLLQPLRNWMTYLVWVYAVMSVWRLINSIGGGAT